MGYQDLAYAIVEQAVKDYKRYRGIDWRIARIREFFMSDWCNVLLRDTPFTGEEILKRLESETT